VIKILILGGYGGVGSAIARRLLMQEDAAIVICGRNIDKANAYANLLKQQYPNRSIDTACADASEKKSLMGAFRNVDFVIVAATVPEHIGTIAEAAIENSADMLDILVRGDVVDKLEKYRSEIANSKRIFITQAGFHPGLPAPFIKYARKQFDRLDSANILMVMKTKFECPESTHEIIYEIGNNKARILKNGEWKRASYKDALQADFSAGFGQQLCFPLQMREINSLPEETGVKNMGVYAAGFTPFVDNFVFPLIMILQTMKKGLGTKLCGKLMCWAVNKAYDNKPGVEFMLQAIGIKDEHEQKYELVACCSDAFEFTALAVLACMRPYLDGFIARPGLYLMGNIVDPDEIINHLKEFGVVFREALQ